METDKTVVVTGATGFLGREFVHHLLSTEPKTRLTLLVRGKDDADARARGRAVLEAGLSGGALADAHARVTTVRADLERDRLGLDTAAYDALAARTEGVIHGAASVSFTLPLVEARGVNVEGTRRILDFAAKAGVRTDYIGTAYVAGERSGLALESELDKGQAFRNTYEQTKMEAEKLAHDRSASQPIAIFRPSIIVGDSTTGRTTSFKVMYWPLKAFAHGWARVAPGRVSTQVDIVPSDYVVRAIAHIRRDPASVGRCHHLAAGPERSVTLGELTDLAAEFFDVRKPVFVDPGLFIRYARPVIDLLAFGKLRHMLLTGRVYTPYLSLDVRFDTTNARKALEGTDIVVPPVEDYFAKLFRYCIDSDWGKREPRRSALPS
jgi:thioester reductase-like protein